MKIIIFDLLCAQPIENMKFHGGGEYTKTVFKHLVEMERDERCVSLEVCFDSEKYIDDWIIDIVKEKNITMHDVKSCNDIYLIVLSLSCQNDVTFFSGLASGYKKSLMPFPDTVRKIGVFHGLRMLEKPYDKNAWHYGRIKRRIHEFLDWVILSKRSKKREYEEQKSSLLNFDIIVTVSTHSQYSLKLNYGSCLKGKKIITLYSPLKQTHISSISQTYERYIMMVSADRWLKNSYRGVIALDGLYKNGFLKDIKTKIYGNLPAEISKKLKRKDMFEFLGYVSSEELEAAYSNCEVFFYPTLNEGFGYPPLEAMKYGKTCVISAVCSLPEIYGSSVYYCNPYDIMEMQNRILQAVENKLSPELIFRQFNQIQNRQKKDLDTLCSLLLEEKQSK